MRRKIWSPSANAHDPLHCFLAFIFLSKDWGSRSCILRLPAIWKKNISLLIIGAHKERGRGGGQGFIKPAPPEYAPGVAFS